MKVTKLAVKLFTRAIALISFAAPLSAAPLSVQNKQFLSAYEKVHQALVANDLAAAQKAAADLGPSGDGLAKSKSLLEARGAFAGLSDAARKTTAGQAGYYVVHCPMLHKDWVQTSDKISNPYGSAGLVTCGEIESK
ncbi:MAG: DUF3347 domain-containing protein [Chthoniobacterales bacterium]|nr:DUF3347 domain-containing protein [Chthoniobacterales bacterium]